MTISIPHLKALIERFGELDLSINGGYYPKVRPLVTIEQYFKGSGGEASLWFNQYPKVSKDIDEVAFWKSLRDREDVWDVLISVQQYDFYGEPFEDDENWVSSDTVIVISSADPNDLLAVFPENAMPEFVCDYWDPTGAQHEQTFVPSDMKPLHFWYD